MHKQLTLMIFLLLSIFAGNISFAEEDVSDDKILISNIIIQGNQRVTNDTILSYANISKGDLVSSTLIQDIIKRLYQTNYFDDIAVTQNFNDLIIGEWGNLDVAVDPYSLSTIGATRITSFYDVDIAVRHAESFSAIQDLNA